MGVSIGGKDWQELLNEIAEGGVIGHGPPDSLLETIYDHYLDINTGDVYKKVDGDVWAYWSSIGGALEGASTYPHQQITPAEKWVITHNLECFPSVTIADSAGNTVVGDVQYISENEIIITFTSAFAGNAYLN